MIPLDNKDFNNGGKWKIKHDDTGLYKVYNEFGSSLPSLFTTRKQAEAALESYLRRLEATPRYKRKAEQEQE